MVMRNTEMRIILDFVNITTESEGKPSTHIPSSSKNSVSLCIRALPQPPAISGILQPVNLCAYSDTT